jgi:glycosyltransferase involved in cell wall biosynthesis
VPDAATYIAQAEVCVAPLLTGGGSRLKILEGLALERAIVATPLGAEGLAVRDGEHLLLADSPTAFAAAVLRLLHDPAQRWRLGRQGRELVQTQYDWRLITPSLLQMYESLPTIPVTKS